MFRPRTLELICAMSGVMLLCGCPPDTDGSRERAEDAAAEAEGTYYAAQNKIFNHESPFDIRWKVEHENNRDDFDPRTNVTGREMALQRCTRCHECGFPAAFDLARYGTPEWEPRFTGQQWAGPIRRMMEKDNSFLNEGISARIYAFLREETTGQYDEESDDKGRVRIEVDELPGGPPAESSSAEPAPDAPSAEAAATAGAA